MRDAHLVILGTALALAGCATEDEPGLADAGSSGRGVAVAGRNGAGASAGAGRGGNAGAGGASAHAGSGGSAEGGAGSTGVTAGSGSGSGGNAGVPNGGSGATAGGGAGQGGDAGVLNGGSSAMAGSSSGSGGSAGATAGGIGGMAGSGSGRGGNSSIGGAGATGAAGAAGGAGAPADPPCPPAATRTGGKQVCSAGDGTAAGNYTYNLWSDGKGSGCMTVYGVDAAFKATWMNVGDWIARTGLSFDKSKTYDQIGTFSSDFAYTTSGITTGGFGNVGIYGWTVNPLHEFYIEENWLGKAPNFTKVMSFTIEGEGTYEVMTNTQTNQPNITGTNATFVQYWSVRSTPRQCGHISISKHFDQWKSLGLELGKMEEARISVEGQNNSGTIDFTTATLVVTP